MILKNCQPLDIIKMAGKLVSMKRIKQILKRAAKYGQPPVLTPTQWRQLILASLRTE